jgi:TolA-binding protein
MDTAQVQQLVQGHEAQIQNLLSELNAVKNELAAVKNEVVKTKNDLITAQNHLNQALTARHNYKPKPCLPDPEKFAGHQFTWDTWYPSIQAKLRIDGEAIGGPEAQFFYVYGRLEGKIQALVSPQLQAAQDNEDYDPQELLKQLARLHDDPNKVRDAEDKLQSLKQEEDHLATFLAKFERLLYKAKANTWPDNTKIALLRRGLNKSARARLDTQIIVPEDYEGFVALLQKLSGRQTYTNNGISGNRTGNNAGSKTADPMEIGAISSINKITPVPGREYCHGRRNLTRDDCSWCWRLTLIVENKKLAEERIFGNALAR